jgi:predicted ATPase
LSDNLFAITGGPGAGKTTLIEALAAAGYATAPEAGRAIIIDQAAIGRAGLPARDPDLFAELMLSWDIRSYRWAQNQSGPVFFDHAVPGMAGYYRLVGRPVPPHVTAAIRTFRFNRYSFVAPPWPEIYRTDSERKQTLDEAERTYHAAVASYREHGYTLIELPRRAVAERVDFVLDRVLRAGMR